MEYTFLTLFFLILAFLLDSLILKTYLYKNKKFYLFILIVVILQTVVDNWLNGRYWFGNYIVGPYAKNYYSGIKIWHTPLENYFYGLGLLWMNVSLFEFLTTKKNDVKDFK